MEPDNWDRDPAVQRMRAIFAEMDHIQATLLNQAGIKPFDGRLQSIRATARNLFDRAAARAAGEGIELKDNAMTGLYAACLQKALSMAGIVSPQDLRPYDQALRDLVRAVSG